MKKKKLLVFIPIIIWFLVIPFGHWQMYNIDWQDHIMGTWWAITDIVLGISYLLGSLFLICNIFDL